MSGLGFRVHGVRLRVYRVEGLGSVSSRAARPRWSGVLRFGVQKLAWGVQIFLRPRESSHDRSALSLANTLDPKPLS